MKIFVEGDMKKRNRHFVDGAPYHLCSKGINGFCIFYSFKDSLVFITMFSVLMKEFHLVVQAFCLMINHYHALLTAGDVGTLSAFVCRLESAFVAEYNNYHNRVGQLFKHRFRGAPKVIGKLVTSCIIYVFNNPVAGKICSKVLQYRWNLLAYGKSRNPFSKPLDRAHSSQKLRLALKTVDNVFKNGHWLGYSLLDMLFDGLDATQTNQLIDYILAKYRIIDYEVLSNKYGSYEGALTAIEASAGSEYEIKEDWEDYGLYEKMKKFIQDKHFPQTVNFETMPKQELASLFRQLSALTAAPAKQVRKFLHIKGPDA